MKGKQTRTERERDIIKEGGGKEKDREGRMKRKQKRTARERDRK